MRFMWEDGYLSAAYTVGFKVHGLKRKNTRPPFIVLDQSELELLLKGEDKKMWEDVYCPAMRLGPQYKPPPFEEEYEKIFLLEEAT